MIFTFNWVVSHGLELMKDVSLDLGAMAGYYYADSTNQKGISDIDFSTALTVTKGIISYSAGFHYVIVPSKDFYYGTDGGKNIQPFLCHLWCFLRHLKCIF